MKPGKPHLYYLHGQWRMLAVIIWRVSPQAARTAIARNILAMDWVMRTKR